MVSLSPMVIYLISVVNPSGLEIIAALNLWVSGILLVKEKFLKIPNYLLITTFISAVVLVLSRPDGPEWALIIFTILILIAKRDTLRLLIKNKLFKYLLAVLILISIIGVGWNVIEHASTVIPGSLYPKNADIVYIAGSVLGQSQYLVNGMVGLLGWANAPTPYLTQIIWLLCLGCMGLLAIGSFRKKQWRDTLGLVGLVAIVIAIPVIYTLHYAHLYGNILQGRYMLPGAVGVVIVASMLIKGLTYRQRLTITKTLIAAASLGNIVAFIWILRRYMVGLATFDIFKKVPGYWSPPIPAALFIILFILINIIIVFVMWGVAENINIRSLETTQ
jgi:hypothetical protein